MLKVKVGATRRVAPTQGSQPMMEEAKSPDGKSCRSHDEPMIVVKEVHKSFGKNHVLRGVNLEVKCGETMVVIGGSGTGKSVLLKCIIGLLRHDRGEIYVDGQEISHLKEKDGTGC